MTEKVYDLIYIENRKETDLEFRCSEEEGKRLASSYADAKKQALMSWTKHLTGFVGKARFVEESDREHVEYRLEVLL